MTAIAAIHVLCESNPSLGASVVNGLLAWATVLGGLTIFCSGLPAAVCLLVPGRSETLTDRINRGLGYGFLLGMPAGLLTCIVFVARIAT
jgi:hypothetical protein